MTSPLHRGDEGATKIKEVCVGDFPAIAWGIKKKEEASK